MLTTVPGARSSNAIVVVVAALIASGCRYTSDLRLPEHQAASSERTYSQTGSRALP